MQKSKIGSQQRGEIHTEFFWLTQLYSAYSSHLACLHKNQSNKQMQSLAVSSQAFTAARFVPFAVQDAGDILSCLLSRTIDQAICTQVTYFKLFSTHLITSICEKLSVREVSKYKKRILTLTWPKHNKPELVKGH